MLQGRESEKKAKKLDEKEGEQQKKYRRKGRAPQAQIKLNYTDTFYSKNDPIPPVCFHGSIKS